MEDTPFASILVAEDNDISREMIVSILQTQGYKIYEAVDGESAIEIIQHNNIDLGLVDINMAPKSGFDFIKFLIAHGIDLPIVIITADYSSDILVEATALGVTRIMQKPVDPKLLTQVVQRILTARGLNVKPFAVTATDVHYSHDELMMKAIRLADNNAKAKKGGPYGAVIADSKGVVLGEGINGIAARADPGAHAEVMAIRQAAEKLGQSDLSDCTLYCSSEPTMIGQALVTSVGIKKVYYGISHEEVHKIREEMRKSLRKKYLAKTDYEQLCHDEALNMFKTWQIEEEEEGEDAAN